MNNDFSSYEDSQLFGHAKRLYEQNQFEKSFSAYTELSRRGYIGCYIFLGWMCYEGKGTVRDELIALEWFKKAAGVGSAPGQYYCARLLEKIGKPEESLLCLKTAVSQGYGPALCRMGRMLLVGRNVPIDIRQALKLLGHAASLGNVFAKRELARVLMRDSVSPLQWVAGFLRLLFAVCEGFVIALIDPRSERIQT
jgi:TPR repeat protein